MYKNVQAQIHPTYLNAEAHATRTRTNMQVSIMQEKHTEGYKEAVRRLLLDIELDLLTSSPNMLALD